MKNNYLTIEELKLRIEKLETENKKLRFRPSMNSEDSNIMDFMNIKSQMAEAMLDASDIEHAIGISMGYLTKMIHIHGVLFYRYDENLNKIDLIKNKSIPKKFLADICKTQLTDSLGSIFFPQNIYLKELMEPGCDFLYKNTLSNISTIAVIPILKNASMKISVMLISKREFINKNYLQIILHNLQAQLRSSFTRVANLNNAAKSWEEEETTLRTRLNDFEKINLDLMHQLSNIKIEFQNSLEESAFMKGIPNEQKDILIRINLEGQILYHNSSFQNLNLISKTTDANNICNYLGDGDFPGLNQVISDFDRGAQQVSCETQLLLDQLIWFNVFFIPIKNHRGMIFEIQIVGRNIDTLKFLENQLKQQNEILLSIVRPGKSIGFTLDINGKILSLTDGWEELLGYKKEECLNREIYSYLVLQEQELLKNTIRDFYASDKQIKKNLNLITSSGKRKACEIKLFNAQLPENQLSIIIGSLTPLK